MQTEDPKSSLPCLKIKHNFKYHFDIATVAANCHNCGIEIVAGALCLKDVENSVNAAWRGVCVNCRICPSGHNLNYVYDLRDLGESLYGENRYNCDLCSATKKLTDRVLHCPSCEFDLCPHCERLVFCFQTEEFP